MSKLFDEFEEEPIDDEFLEISVPDEEEEDEAPTVSKLSHDKIFDNDYNTGNLDFEEYSNLPRVDSTYAEGNLRECYDSYEYNRNFELEGLIDTYFKNIEQGKIFANKKKIPKQMLPTLFVSIREQFKGSDYTSSEIFTAIADYFCINYETLYENIPSVYRADLVKELDEKYGILKRKGLKRLF